MKRFVLILFILSVCNGQVSFSNFAGSSDGLKSLSVDFTSSSKGVAIRNFQLKDAKTGANIPLDTVSITPSGNSYGLSFPAKLVPAGSYQLSIRNDPPTFCSSPAPDSVANPDATVGSGTAQSCTEAALRAAVQSGGKIVFNCGANPVTIPINSVLSVPLAKSTIIDGNGLVTLDGQGKTRILEIQTTFDKSAPLVSVQNLKFINGFTTDVPNTGSTTTGGAAMYRLGGAFHIYNCEFTSNHGPVTGQDVAGGAVYSVGGGATIVVNSTFTKNSCSNGGGIGNLGNNFTIINSAVIGNVATGNNGNPGNGGNGGGISFDGAGVVTTICGSTISHNTGNAFGGGIFRVGYPNLSPTNVITITDSSFDNNFIPHSGSLPSQGGSVYLQGLSVTIAGASVNKNGANFAAGIFFGPDCTLDIQNLVVANNTADTGLGGGIVFSSNTNGALKKSTLMGNAAPGSVAFGGGVASAPSTVTLQNTIIAYSFAGNAFNPISCTGKFGEGGNNYQFPITRTSGQSDDPCCLCSASINKQDPKVQTSASDEGCPFDTVPILSGSPVSNAGADCATKQKGNRMIVVDLKAPTATSPSGTLLSRGPIDVSFVLNGDGSIVVSGSSKLEKCLLLFIAVLVLLI